MRNGEGDFNCSECPERIKKMRRCGEDRDDFTEDDNKAGMNWPMFITKGGSPFGFCPAKAGWDRDLVEVYEIMSLCAEIGDLRIVDGGLFDQPTWWIENMAWFLPAYNHNKFYSRVRSLVGDEKLLKSVANKAGLNGGNNGQPTNRRKR